jgi:hypothetical protein
MIAEHDDELIHDYIPALAARQAVGKVADIENQDFDNGVVVGKHLTAGDILPHL